MPAVDLVAVPPAKRASLPDFDCRRAGLSTPSALSGAAGIRAKAPNSRPPIAKASGLPRSPEFGIRSVAFPSISTGVYGFPLEHAAEIAITEIEHFLAGSTSLERVVLCAYSRAAYETYLDVANAFSNKSQVSSSRLRWRYAP